VGLCHWLIHTKGISVGVMPRTEGISVGVITHTDGLSVRVTRTEGISVGVIRMLCQLVGFGPVERANIKFIKKCMLLLKFL